MTLLPLSHPGRGGKGQLSEETILASAVQMKGIVKRFPGVLANNQIDFEVEQGEIHALLGENGAGKSTLMNVLYGLYHPDGGQIYWQGQPVTFHSPRDAITLGIGMVHQDFQLIPTLTVAQNVALGLRSPREPFYDAAQTEKQIQELSARYGLTVDPRAKVWQLDAGTQQRVEIIKALYRQARFLILDEPTSVLTPQEVDELFNVLQTLVAEGCSVVFITHKLDEVMQISDRITVLRDGQKIATVPTAETTTNKLARMMVGRELPTLSAKEPVENQPLILEVEAASAMSDKNLSALKGVSLAVRGGEILGIAGIAGNGQSELAEAITGLRPVLSGQIRVRGEDITNHSPHRIAKQGVAYITEKPREKAVFMEFPLDQNAILKQHRSEPISRYGLLNFRRILEYTRRLMKTFDVRAPGPKTLARQLSGGNLQKLVVGREFWRKPDLIVAAQPTVGLDVSAAAYIHQQLLEARAEGRAILLISADLDEILTLSDRVAVMYEGEIVGQMPVEQINIERLGLMMAGVHREELEQTA